MRHKGTQDYGKLAGAKVMRKVFRAHAPFLSWKVTKPKPRPLPVILSAHRAVFPSGSRRKLQADFTSDSVATQHTMLWRPPTRESDSPRITTTSVSAPYTLKYSFRSSSEVSEAKPPTWIFLRTTARQRVRVLHTRVDFGPPSSLGISSLGCLVGTESERRWRGRARECHPVKGVSNRPGGSPSFLDAPPAPGSCCGDWAAATCSMPASPSRRIGSRLARRRREKQNHNGVHYRNTPWKPFRRRGYAHLIPTRIRMRGKIREYS